MALNGTTPTITDNGKRKDGNTKEDKAEKGSPEDLEPTEDTVPFKDLSCREQCKTIVVVTLKITAFLTCLYLFICALGLLENAFQLLGGKTAGEAFSSGVLSNPFAGLMIGVLATVLVQSSSTSSSIVVAMVGSKIIPVEKAVPIIMGANIGTSVTNTVVSLAQVSDRGQFRRAFAGATVHDMFNWLSVLLLLPLEIAVGYLGWLSGKAVKSLGLEGNNAKTPDMLKAITGPLIDSIVDVNKDIIKEVAASSNASTGDVLMRWCEVEDVLVENISPELQAVTVNCEDEINKNSLFASTCQIMVDEQGLDPSAVATLWVGYNKTVQEMMSVNIKRCDNLFAQTNLSDAAAGSILLIISLIVIMGTLYCIVKILNSMLSGSVTRAIRKSINADFPYPCGYLTGYVAMLVGVGLTILVQSSSVFTSTLTPMVGLGIVSVERMYPMTLGSNVGTTVTSILAALSQSGDQLKDSLQIAFCHLFFNISGIILFYPVPFMRWPIGMAKVLGKTTAKHRWFAIFYLIIMFIVLPGSVFALSYAGWVYLAAVGGPILFIFLLVVLINALQRKRPGILPKWLRDWEFLPLCCHSLKPVDTVIAAICRCGFCQSLQHASRDVDDDDSDNDKKLDDNETAVLRELDEVAVDRDEDHVTRETRPLGNGGAPMTGSDNLAFQMDTKF